MASFLLKSHIYLSLSLSLARSLTADYLVMMMTVVFIFAIARAVTDGVTNMCHGNASGVVAAKLAMCTVPACEHLRHEALRYII